MREERDRGLFTAVVSVAAGLELGLHLGGRAAGEVGEDGLEGFEVAAFQRLRDRSRLREDFLQHEVAVARLFHRGAGALKAQQQLGPIRTLGHEHRHLGVAAQEKGLTVHQFKSLKASWLRNETLQGILEFFARDEFLLEEVFSSLQCFFR